jgi:RimJ/RimL family protein N-acetyltransferase
MQLAPRQKSLVTPRLVLEPQIAAHAPQMFTLLQDPSLYRYENEAPSSVEWLEARFRRLESRASADGREWWLNWVVRQDASTLIGFVQATVCEDHHASIAYVVGSAYWGQGYACEAVTAMLDELLLRFAVIRFSAVLKRDNTRSVRLLERLGFVLDTDGHDIHADEIRMQRGPNAPRAEQEQLARPRRVDKRPRT